jgi:peptide/nickel transport system substrate-binding protein
MLKNKLSTLFALLVVLSLVMAACGPAPEATDAPAEPTAAEGEPTAAEVEPTAEPAFVPPSAEELAAMAEFEGISLAAESCDYGGKVLSIEAVDVSTVVFTLCRPDPAFLAKVAFTPFGIQPQEWIAQNGGTGEMLEHPIGTGPYMVQEWVRGEQLVYTAYDGYWGEPAYAQTAVLRWLTEGAARLQELQAGTADYVTSISPADLPTVEGDANLQLIRQDNPNVLYIGFTNTFAPFDNVLVRQAIAMGIDRQRIVDSFYPAGSEVASHFTPCSIANGCEGDAWYDFDPEAARALLAEAGFPDGFETTIFYRDASRPYILEPARVAVDIQTQLAENLGITAEVQVMESGEFIDQATSGLLDGIHLLGWGADYPHVTNFLDFHFGENQVQFGTNHPEIYEILQEASSIADVATAAPLYAEANNAIRELVPVVPVAHGAVLHAATASLGGAYYPPYGAPQFYKLDTGDDDLVYIQNAEPISLLCADETDGESLTACQQVVETLLEYADDSGDTVAELATECTPNEDSSVWTCSLREGVTFHDGSAFDADDVVASFAFGLDASSPYHNGNTGSFDYPGYLWDGFMNVPAE